MFLNTAVRGGYDGDTGQYLMKWVKFINPTEDILTFCFPEISLTVSWRLDLNEVEKRKYSLIGFEKIHKDDVIEKSVMKTKSNDSFLRRTMKDVLCGIAEGFLYAKDRTIEVSCAFVVLLLLT